MKCPHGSRWCNVYGESLAMTAVSAAMSICMLMSCNPPRWVKYGQTKAWILQETSTVCIEVPPENLLGVVTAIEAWETAIGNWKHLEPRKGITEECTYTIREELPGPQISPFILATVTGVGNKEILLFKGRYEFDPIGITLHELGHAFGARHMAGTLMAPYVQPGVYRCPDAATVAQVAIANSVDPSLLLWCHND